MSEATGKSRAEKAAERAEMLENMTNEDKDKYRQRKDYVGIKHEWRQFFQDMDPDAVKEMVLAIIDYDKSGEVPNFKNSMLRTVFNAFIKTFLDHLLNEWYLTCHTARVKGKAGADVKAQNREMVRRLTEIYKAPVYQGVPFERLLKPDSDGWQELHDKGATSLEINQLKQKIEESRGK